MTARKWSENVSRSAMRLLFGKAARQELVILGVGGKPWSMSMHQLRYLRIEVVSSGESKFCSYRERYIPYYDTEWTRGFRFWIF